MHVGWAQVRSHRDEWDLGRCSLPARLAWTASLAVWSAKEAARDVREGGSGAMKKLTDRGDGDEQVSRAEQGVCMPAPRTWQPGHMACSIGADSGCNGNLMASRKRS